MNYWFGFKALPDGAARARGPFPDADTANRERTKEKRGDAEVSPWFVAESEDEAEQKAKWHLDGGDFPEKN
ncbi:hypothetical protein [Marinobacter salicampi]|uniref:hypothetical protein n=1 Tax=Marinobacter salicampi TaxID=435907 RepID=UPI00140BE382|nr:hypothetical protein [Marinobacter salicampi]